jgi:hypothetical protein
MRWNFTSPVSRTRTCSASAISTRASGMPLAAHRPLLAGACPSSAICVLGSKSLARYS